MYIYITLHQLIHPTLVELQREKETCCVITINSGQK